MHGHQVHQEGGSQAGKEKGAESLKERNCTIGKDTASQERRIRKKRKRNNLHSQRQQ
jgi:hypothetical protein